MKLNKILFSLFAAFSFLAVSCQVEEQVYVPGEPELDGCHGVYFPTQEAAGAHTMDPSETPAVEFVVKRLSEDGDITVPVEVKVSEEGIFNVPELQFVDGQTEAKLLVTFPNAKAGVEYTLSLEINDPEYALVYGANPTYLTYSVTIERYDLMGIATYREDILTALFTVPNQEWQCEVYTKESTPGVYYFKNLYTSTCPFHSPGEYVEEDLYFTVNAANTGKVYIPAQPLGWDWGYGMAWAASLCQEAGFNVDSGAYGSLVNGVITFPVQGLLFAMEGYQDMGFFYANKNGLARFILPGAILTDYTISLEAGFASQGTQPVAFTFGTDVQTIKYAAFEGPLSKGDLQAKVAEIAADKNAQVVAKPEADAEGNVPAAVVGFSFEATGEYTIVAVGCDSEGTAQSSTSLVISYVAANDEVPVIVTAGLGAADKYVPQGFSPETAIEYYVYGQDLEEVKIGMFTAADFIANQQGCISALMTVPSEPAEVLEMINTDVFVDVMGGLTPGTEYYLLVWASNGYEQKIIATAPWTTAGDPLPVYQSYSVEDISEDLMPATSEGFFGTWNYYAKDLYAKVPQTLRNYQGQVTISDSEMPDIPAEEDPNGYGLPTEYVDVKGLFADNAEYWGFDDTMPFEFYGGVLYTVAWGFDASESGYYPASMYATPAGSLNFYNGTMIGAYVSEGYVAFVDCTGGQILPDLYLGMFADEAYSSSSFAGVGAGYSDLLLINPENDDNGLAPEAAASAMSVAELDNLRFSLASDVNYVETERGRIHSAIDRANAIKTVGQAAGVQGEYNAQPATFSAVEAQPLYETATSDYKKVNDSAAAIYR
ncbi:MAG: hypothetical protein J6Q88_04410 [Bacteroidales bacterium]|nr:hypothetical protein [Bacteroidales bacterium]